jgi:cobalt-zinc-cadmium efflux system outer membrane protein
VEIQIRTEINEAWNLYYVHCRQVENFEHGLLRMASDVMKGKIYSYQRGETSLLEVLNAQRTYNDIQSAYYNALYDRASALINLERSAGIWDISF